MKRVAILHYASPPTVGGVESTIAYHARGLVELGLNVRVISGAGGSFDERIETHIDPLFGSKHPDILHAKQQLDAGHVPEDFDGLTQTLYEALRRALKGCDALIAHNVHTLHKNLPLTAALARFTQETEMPLVAWCHDLAWTNEQYQRELYNGYPWDLLRQPWSKTCYVTVSEPRRTEIADLLDIPPERVHVVVPGVDVARFFHWTETTQRLVAALDLMNADGVLLLPARLTRRKNIELALSVLAELRTDGRDWRLVVTGPPGPHNPTNRGYLGALLDQRAALNLQDSAHFVYAHGANDDAPLIPDDDTMANLYQLADALFFPSLQEGFGIPVLEAGLAGIPVFCSDIPPFRQTGGGDVTYFDPQHDSPAQIAAQLREVLHSSGAARLRVRVRQAYRWERIIQDCILPLLEGQC